MIRIRNFSGWEAYPIESARGRLKSSSRFPTWASRISFSNSSTKNLMGMPLSRYLRDRPKQSKPSINSTSWIDILRSCLLPRRNSPRFDLLSKMKIVRESEVGTEIAATEAATVVPLENPDLRPIPQTGKIFKKKAFWRWLVCRIAATSPKSLSSLSHTKSWSIQSALASEMGGGQAMLYYSSKVREMLSRP